MFSLLELFRWVAVMDNAAAGMETHFAASDGDRADRDSEIACAVPADIACRACIRPARDRLQLINDFHRPHFWRSADSASWKHRFDHVEHVDIVSHLPRHLRYEVHHVRVAFDDLAFLDAHRAASTDAADVVSP